MRAGQGCHVLSSKFQILSPGLFGLTQLPKESTLECAHSGECPNHHELEEGCVQHCNTTLRNKGRDTRELHRRGSMRRRSPERDSGSSILCKSKFSVQTHQSICLTGALNDHGSYNPNDRELRSAQAAALSPSPPTVRQNVPYMEPLRSTPPQVAKLAAQSSTSVKARAPDKSLQVQEEPEEDGADEQNDNQEQERDRWTTGGSEYRRSAHRHESEVRDPGRQLHSTASPTPSSDILPEGYDPR